MKVRQEIELYAKPEDKECLLWLLTKYHWASEWSFVASCTFDRYGTKSYQTHRVWHPKDAGRILYNNKKEFKCDV